MDKICINGFIREMTAEEIKEQANEFMREETQSERLEERLEKLESLLAKFIGSSE
ncbi:MAG: hypothetical protein IKT52_08510 [Oscillospiraceae bacterium]|nr:hypothetical protein [Oscillospiraceae bacterium]